MTLIVNFFSMAEVHFYLQLIKSRVILNVFKSTSKKEKGPIFFSCYLITIKIGPPTFLVSQSDYNIH